MSDRQTIYVLKTGGAVLEDATRLDPLLSSYAALDQSKILVHGGGRKATTIAEALGVRAPMVEGRRITDDDMLEVAVMTYGGLMNKQLVAQLQGKGVNALGLTGADGNLIKAHKRAVKAGIDYGWAGDIDQVNTELLTTLLQADLSPVVASITHNQYGQLLNTNADTIATEIAVALSETHEVHLIFLFEQAGVLTSLEDPDSLITHLDPSVYQKLKDRNKIHSGMVPKLDNAFDALARGVESVRIGRYDRLNQIIAGEQNFTMITS